MWSGTHNLIAYIHYQKLQSDDLDSLGIYIIKSDGTEKTLLYASDFVVGLDWAQDGQWLVTDDNGMLVIISFPRGEANTITGRGEYFLPVSSPTADFIAFSDHIGANAGVYIIKADGSQPHRVIEFGKSVAWPYGDSFLYLNVDRTLPLGSLCLADTGGGSKQVVYQPSQNFIPYTLKAKMHSASGMIVFDPQEIGQLESIWTLEPGATEASKLRANAMRPNFSPDGDRIVFTNGQGDIGRLWIINWDGDGAQLLTR